MPRGLSVKDSSFCQWNAVIGLVLTATIRKPGTEVPRTRQGRGEGIVCPILQQGGW